MKRTPRTVNGIDRTNLPPLGELVCTMAAELNAKSKQRPRAGKSGHFYTPKQTIEYEQTIRDLARVFYDEPPVAFPVTLIVDITHTIPKSWPAYKRQIALDQLIFPSRGDLDNKVKAISDGLNGIVFLDDSQICRLVANMKYGTEQTVSVNVTRAGYTLEEVMQHYEESN